MNELRPLAREPFRVFYVAQLSNGPFVLHTSARATTPVPLDWFPMQIIRRIHILVVGVLLLLPVSFVRAQSVDTMRITVHGHQLQLLVSGTGGPTVILESGDRSRHRAWRRLRDSLSAFTQVVAYDRAGLGQSELCPGTRDAQTIARELRDALTEAKIAPPYLLVGHSAGTIFVRVFASLFPNEVHGVLLLDPAMVDFEPRARRTYSELVKKFLAFDSIDLLTNTPGELADEAGWEMSLKQAKVSDATFRSPTILLSAGLRPKLGLLEGMFREEQQRWAARKSNVMFRVVSRSPSARRE